MSVYDIACDAVLGPIQATLFLTHLNFIFNNNKLPHALLLLNSKTTEKKESCDQLWPSPVHKPVYYTSLSLPLCVCLCVFMSVPKLQVVKSV